MFKLFKSGFVQGVGYMLGVVAVTALVQKIAGQGNENETSKEEAQD